MCLKVIWFQFDRNKYNIFKGFIFILKKYVFVWVWENVEESASE